MSISRKEEARALSADETELVEKSHHPAVQDLSDVDLSGLVKLLRERRDKAQSEAHRRRRVETCPGQAGGLRPARTPRPAGWKPRAR